MLEPSDVTSTVFLGCKMLSLKMKKVLTILNVGGKQCGANSFSGCKVFCLKMKKVPSILDVRAKQCDVNSSFRVWNALSWNEEGTLHSQC